MNSLFFRIASVLAAGWMSQAALLAGTPDYIRPNAQYSSETTYPKFAGVPQLTAVPAGQVPKYYSKLAFSGGTENARGALASAGAGGNPWQRRTEVSGSIDFSYNATTDQVSWVNQTLQQSGEVLGVPPWDPATTSWPEAPVLTVTVPVSGGGPVGYGEWYMSINNPLGLTVLSAVRAADDNIFRGGVFSGVSLDPVEWRDYRVMELQNEDTREMAESRAKVYKDPNIVDINSTSTLGGMPTGNITSWTIRKVHLKYDFSGSPVCEGGGNLFEQRIVYEWRRLGTTTWEEYKTVTSAVTLKDNEGELDLPLEDGYEIRIKDFTLEVIGGDCTSCGSGGTGLAGGNRGPTTGSIRWQIPLGHTATGESAGFLTLYSPNVTPALYTPAALRASVLGENAAVVLDAQSAVRQVLAPQALADIVTTSTSSYEIRLYDRADVGALGGAGLYALSGSPYLKWRIDGSPTSGIWRVTRIIGAQSVVMTEVDESQPGRTVFTEAGGLRVTETTHSTEGVDRVEDVVVKDTAGVAASRIKTYYRTFSWGEERVKEIVDPAGAALTTLWAYATAPGGAQRKVISITHPDGSVESYDYLNDASGSIYNHNTPMGKQWIKTTGYRRSLADLDSDGIADNLTSVFQDMFLSNLGLDHTIQWGAPATIGGIKYKLRDQRRSTVPGALWNHPGNIITRERYYAEGVHAGELAYRLNPDGTLLLRRFTANPEGGTSTIEEEGAADASLENVTDGTRTVRVLSPRGREVSTLVTDIASNRTLSSEVVGQTDSYGRPTQLQHLDGAVETRSYCQSCGAVEQISLRGETVAYEFDELGRKLWETRSADATVMSRQRFEYDAAGRLTKTFRINPTDDSETLVASATYDLAGRVASSTSLQSGTTAYTYAFGANNSTITTTTYADSGTRIETRGASGDLFRLGGTTVAPLEHDWQTFSWDGRGTGYVMSTRRYYSPTDYVLEYAGFNFIGEVYETTLGDGAVSRRYFDAVGRRAREVDPDGVTTLYGYDARGRQVVRAVDINGNNTIDYAGTDRITRTLSSVGVRDGRTVERTETQLWEVDLQTTPTTVSISEQSVDGLASWQTVRGLTSSTLITHDGTGGRIVVSTTPDGTISTQTYLGDRLLGTVAERAGLGSLASVTNDYNSIGQLITSTDARTGVTTYAYDAQDRLQSITTPDPDPVRSGPGYDPQTTAFGYDAMGRQTTVTQPDGGVVNTTYWPHGQVKRTWGSRTYPVEYTYDVQLRVKTLTTWQDFASSAGASVTTWNYNPARGWLDNKRYSDNSGPSYLYKPSGRLLRRTWARGVQTNYAYNAAGEPTGTTYSDGTPAVTIAYDRAGRPNTITDGSGVRTLSYDTSGQLKDEDYTAGLLATLGVHRTFDALQRLDSLSAFSAASAVNQIGYSYDAASRLNAVTSGTNTATYGYLPNSPLVQSVTFAQGGTTRLTTTKVYDNLNRLTSISSAPSAASALNHLYSYSSANQRTRVTREDNARWDYTYDALGQVTSGKKFDATLAPLPGHDFAWTYDDIGNRKTATVNGQTSGYTANLLNQYSSRTIPGGFDVLAAAEPAATVTYQYPASTGVPTPLPRVGDLLYTQLTADNSARNVNAEVKITGVKNLIGPGGEDAVTEINKSTYFPQNPLGYTHDADGNLTADGRWVYAWDGENRLKSVETAPAALLESVKREKQVFTYDAQGRRVAKVATGYPEPIFSALTANYYAAVSDTQVGAILATQTFPSRWNLSWPGTVAPASGVPANPWIAQISSTLQVPVSGNYTFNVTMGPVDALRLYLDDVFVLNLWNFNGPRTGQVTVALQAGQTYQLRCQFYNGGSDSSLQLQASTATGTDIATRYLYDGWNLLAEVDAIGAATKTYVWGSDLSGSMQGAGGVGGLLFTNFLLSAASSHVPAFDGNGNVVGLIDMATGAKSATYEYGAFGETLIADGVAAEALPFRFSTKYTDVETGLLYYGLRYMRDGRWLSRDSLQEQGGVNLYGFIGNDPVNDADLLGQRSIYTDVAGSFDSKKPTRSEYGSLYYSRHEITLKLCCAGQTDKLADEIYARMKEFKDFNSGNIASVTTSVDGFALFFPNSAAELLGSMGAGHMFVSVSLSFNDGARLVGARTTGSHFLTGTRTWGVRSSGQGTIKIFTYAYENFSSPQFAVADAAISFVPFVKRDFHSRAKVTWNQYLSNIANFADSQAKICEKSGIQFEEQKSLFGDNPTLRD